MKKMQTLYFAWYNDKNDPTFAIFLLTLNSKYCIIFIFWLVLIDSFFFSQIQLFASGNESKSSFPTSKPLPAKTTAVLNVGEDDEITITGYERSIVKTILLWIGFVLSAGLIRLFMHWRRHWLLLATHRPCGLNVAKTILISEHFEGKHTIHYVKNVITLDADSFR